MSPLRHSALLVGGVDYVVRPRLMGQVDKMHELLIFFSKLGGSMADSDYRASLTTRYVRLRDRQ